MSEFHCSLFFLAAAVIFFYKMNWIYSILSLIFIKHAVVQRFSICPPLLPGIASCGIYFHNTTTIAAFALHYFVTTSLYEQYFFSSFYHNPDNNRKSYKHITDIAPTYISQFSQSFVRLDQYLVFQYFSSVCSNIQKLTFYLIALSLR